MATLADALDFVIHHRPGLSDRELSVALYGSPSYEQTVKGECQHLMLGGRVHCRTRPDGDQAYYGGIATPAELGR
jgi:hypothetical protein